MSSTSPWAKRPAGVHRVQAGARVRRRTGGPRRRGRRSRRPSRSPDRHAPGRCRAPRTECAGVIGSRASSTMSSRLRLTWSSASKFGILVTRSDLLAGQPVDLTVVHHLRERLAQVQRLLLGRGDGPPPGRSVQDLDHLRRVVHRRVRLPQQVRNGLAAGARCAVICSTVWLERLRAAHRAAHQVNDALRPLEIPLLELVQHRARPWLGTRKAEPARRCVFGPATSAMDTGWFGYRAARVARSCGVTWSRSRAFSIRRLAWRLRVAQAERVAHHPARRGRSMLAAAGNAPPIAPPGHAAGQAHHQAAHTGRPRHSPAPATAPVPAPTAAFCADVADHRLRRSHALGHAQCRCRARRRTCSAVSAIGCCVAPRLLLARGSGPGSGRRRCERRRLLAGDRGRTDGPPMLTGLPVTARPMISPTAPPAAPTSSARPERGAPAAARRWGRG